MAGRKKTGKEFNDILEITAKQYMGEIPGAYSDEYLVLQAKCIRDLAMAFILEQARRGVWKASGAAWYNVEKADLMIIQLGGAVDESSQAIKVMIEGFDPKAITTLLSGNVDEKPS